MESSGLRSWLFHLRYTPFHPQWFAYRCERKRHSIVGKFTKGTVLDIGCGKQTIRKYLDPSVTYFSIDSADTGKKMYNAQPSVFGEATLLPFKDNCFDTLILLEVLEHLPTPAIAIQEALRVLKKNGQLIISTPFLYPIHDAPGDYQRWTKHGLRQLTNKTGLIITDSQQLGSPCETGMLLFNLSLAWTTLNGSLIVRVPLFMLSILLIPLFNLLGYAITQLSKPQSDTPFAISYLLVAKKQEK